MIGRILANRPKTPPPKGKTRFPWTVVLPWGLTGAILVGAAVLALMPRGVKTEQPPPGSPGALVWGDGLFTNALELQAWLRVRGVSYKTWARRHPAGVKLVAPPPGSLRPSRPAKAAVKKTPVKKVPVKKVPVKKATAAKEKVKPSRTTSPAAESAATRPDSPAATSGGPSWLLPVLLAGACLVLLLVARRRFPSFPAWAQVDEDGSRRRFVRSVGGYAGLAVVAVSLGFLVPLLFG
jgi:hypothetical protein